MIQPYTQTTYETCLACSLLQAVDRIKPIKIDKELELEIINHSLRFSKDDFAIGHLDFIVNRFDVSILRILDNKLMLNWINKIKGSLKIKNEAHKVNLKLIDQFLDKKPILSIDSFYLFGVYHYPHWITILGKKDTKYKIFDTWDGKIKEVESEILSKAIISLRNHIKLCPQLLVVSK